MGCFPFFVLFFCRGVPSFFSPQGLKEEYANFVGAKGIIQNDYLSSPCGRHFPF